MNVIKTIHLNVDKSGADQYEFRCADVIDNRFNVTIIGHHDSTRTVQYGSIKKLLTGDLA